MSTALPQSLWEVSRPCTDKRMRDLPSPFIDLTDVVDGGQLSMRLLDQCRFHDGCDVKETDGPGEKTFDSDLIGCVERRWRGAAGLQGLAREAQSREAVRVRSFEGKPCERSEIKSMRRRRHPVGPGQRIGDRCAHRSDERRVGRE